MDIRKPIRPLPPEVARKIAAGEVIERPASVVRELLENSIDSRASLISLSIQGGGIDRIRVVDDGCGMSREDLENACRPHSTSKIGSEEDLLSISSLGFRGEALGSIATVSRLEIISAQEDGMACRLTVLQGGERRIEPWKGNKGTIIESSALFANFPARRKFLKRPSAEAQACRQTFLDRALPCPEIEFRLSNESDPRLALPPSSFMERALAAYPQGLGRDFFREIRVEEENFGFSLVFGLPETKRRDRRLEQVFVNRRRIQEFALLQAMEYGFSGFLPGGCYPVSFLFLEIDPALVDFNIHPAKKEARFKDLNSIHRSVSRRLHEALLGETGGYSVHIPERQGQTVQDLGFSEAGYSSPSAARDPALAPSSVPYGKFEDSGLGFTAREEAFSSLSKAADATHAGFRYLGQVLGLFLLAEKDGKVYLVDQHAAHERILFDRLLAKGPETQDLLVPLVFETEGEAEDEYLRTSLQTFKEAGFTLERECEGSWQLTSAPSILGGVESKFLKEAISQRVYGEQLKRSLFASVACKAAVKDGSAIDPVTGIGLLEGAFALREPRCPHGRPVWYSLSREELFIKVGRIS